MDARNGQPHATEPAEGTPHTPSVVRRSGRPGQRFRSWTLRANGWSGMCAGNWI